MIIYVENLKKCLLIIAFSIGNLKLRYIDVINCLVIRFRKQYI